MRPREELGRFGPVEVIAEFDGPEQLVGFILPPDVIADYAVYGPDVVGLLESLCLWLSPAEAAGLAKTLLSGAAIAFDD